MIAEPVMIAAGSGSARVTHFLAPVAALIAITSAPVWVPMSRVEPSTTGSVLETEPATPL
jgi:hypothetical protein